jgi:hypothetical protein
MAVGGSGGHFSPEYFDALWIPNFPDELKTRIVKLYHAPPPGDQVNTPSLRGFVSYHRSRNNKVGIWELATELKALQAELTATQEAVIQGKAVSVPLPD